MREAKKGIRFKMIKQEDKSVPELQWLCRSILQAASPAFRDMEIDACFYPYIGLTHTIRRKGARWIVRISDHCRHAPVPVLEAIVRILACKIMRRRPRQQYLQAYNSYRNDQWIEEAVRERRLKKGRKHIGEEDGKHHSLREIFLELNHQYFNDQVEIRRIGWGFRKSWRRLGHYDPAHHTITLSPALDEAGVPRFVVRYVVYHEMLHAVFESTSSERFKRHHTSEFHRAEKAYPDFAVARDFIRDYGSRCRQRNQRRRS
ncbi:MAG: M48 family metallopeptidase [Acidobacteria bacterium]|nr:M48 family metallopeptidase [Acidobacteriota bacterium]